MSGQEGDAPPWKDIGRKEERAGRVNNSYVIISDEAKVSEGLLSEVGTPPPHNPEILHVTVARNTHTHTMET